MNFSYKYHTSHNYTTSSIWLYIFWNGGFHSSKLCNRNKERDEATYTFIIINKYRCTAYFAESLQRHTSNFKSMSNTFREWITSEISLTYSPELPPPVCETWIQYWNKDLHTKKYIVDKIQYDCVLFHLPVQLTSYTQNRIISLQCNLPKYSLLREISCFMHIIKNKCATCKLVFQYHPSVLHLCKLLQRYVWFSTMKQIQPKNVRNDDWK